MAARELLAAAERCDVDALRAALQAGEAPAQRREADGWTALHVAVQ
jgi:ankyrin repeat protein